MKVLRKIIEIDEELCDGCGQCVPSCAEGAIEVIDGTARLVADKYCDGLGACLGECPTGALSVVDREAEDFDEEAVEEYLKARDKKETEKTAPLPCACPSSQLRAFAPSFPRKTDNVAVGEENSSALTHWPVQIALVPPTAPFLKGADLLVTADCTPFAYPNFHRVFLQGKVVLVGCPKFDDVKAYIQKFAEIFNTADIKSITIVVMEVPCCQGLPMIVERGMKIANKDIPLEKVIISARGHILKRETAAA
jgi:Pyruvate/2-oxoacid:ferredoxin oxidoreductase delta subunit